MMKIQILMSYRRLSHTHTPDCSNALSIENQCLISEVEHAVILQSLLAVFLGPLGWLPYLKGNVLVVSVRPVYSTNYCASLAGDAKGKTKTAFLEKAIEVDVE